MDPKVLGRCFIGLISHPPQVVGEGSPGGGGGKVSYFIDQSSFRVKGPLDRHEAGRLCRLLFLNYFKQNMTHAQFNSPLFHGDSL